jgi:DNA-binding MarR family transcriptional regulator
MQQRYEGLSGESLLVLRKLQELKSVNFVELSALSGVDDQRLQAIVRELEALNLVKVDNPEDMNEAIVTAREQAFAASAAGMTSKVASRSAA